METSSKIFSCWDEEEDNLWIVAQFDGRWEMWDQDCVVRVQTFAARPSYAVVVQTGREYMRETAEGLGVPYP